jgi:hypothetical protein
VDAYKPKLSIIITNDYEILGNGRGDVDKILIQPTEDILKLCNEYRVPHTLFVDVMEYIKFAEAEENGWLSPKYRAGSKIRKQLRRAVALGHDVQLHIHPQWIGARPVEDDHWKVNFGYWRLPNVPGGLGAIDDPGSLRGIIALGKKTLEKLIQPEKPEYSCIAFRAGAYCIQPEKDVLAALREQGFLIESSVSTGRVANQEYTQYDFRAAPKNWPFWSIDRSVTEIANNSGLIEIPIFTHTVAPQFIRSGPKRSEMALNNVKGLPRRRASLYQRILSYVAPKRLNLDFCKLTSEELIRFTNHARKRFGRLPTVLGSSKCPRKIPVVMTGHSKEWSGPDEFERYLEWASDIDWVEFSTFPEWLASGNMDSRVD